MQGLITDIVIAVKEDRKSLRHDVLVKLFRLGEYDKLFRDGEYENFCIVGVLTSLTTSPPIPETLFLNGMGAYSRSVPKTFYPIILFMRAATTI